MSGGCLNGGTCEVFPSGEARCACQPGYNGTFCEELFGCRQPENACNNGGVCNPESPGSAEVRCFCTAEYAGSACDELVSEPFNVIVAIVIPLSVVGGALLLYLLAYGHARYTGNHAASNGIVIKVVLAIFDFMTDIVFVQAAWSDGGVTIPSLVAVLATVFIVAPFVVNVVLSTRFLVKQIAQAATERPHEYAWFHDGSHQTAIVFAWVVSFMNVDIFALLDSRVFGWSWCQAPWVDRDGAERWLRVALLCGVFLEDIPQLVLQVYLLLNTKPSTVTVIAVSASSLMLVHGLMERVVMWVVRTLSPAGKVVPEFAKPYGDYQLVND